MLRGREAFSFTRRSFSCASDKPAKTGPPQKELPLTNQQKLKLFVRDYGSTVICFHIAHSLASLGVIYTACCAGLDIAWVVERFGLEGKNLSAATGAGTFVIAYALNKVLAPVRFAITFGCTPFIVGYLRRIGFLKTK